MTSFADRPKHNQFLKKKKKKEKKNIFLISGIYLNIFEYKFGILKVS